jgi:hypothetical protein
MLRAFRPYHTASESDLADVGKLDPTTFAADVVWIDASLAKQRQVAGRDQLTPRRNVELLTGEGITEHATHLDH